MALGLFRKKNKSGKKEFLYFDVKVKDIIRETRDSISIVLDNPDNKIQYKPGQYLTLMVTIGGKEERRSYSLSSSPDYDREIIVTVKKVDQGKVSRYLVEDLKPGDEIRIMTPAGNFTTDFSAENRRNLVFFAGGSGITPLISLMKSALVKEPGSKIILIYQNREEGSIIFSDKIEELIRNHPDRIRVTHILSKPSPDWQGERGRLHPEQIKSILGRQGIDIRNSAFFICGPGRMMETIDSTLDELGVDMKNRYRESFSGSGSSSKTDIPSEEPKLNFTESRVTISLDNEKHEILVKPDDFILETALDADIDMPFSCQSGICTSCRGKLISGNVTMDEPEGLSDEELKAGYILTCVSHPATEEITIEIG